MLSERLAARASHLHVIEVDPRLEQPLGDTLSAFYNVTLHIGDALEVDLAGLAPEPTKVIANLPYGIAATVILRTVEELPRLGSWVVMVQREVGERLAAAPGTPAYGVPSVLAQLACEVKVLGPVARTVFRPVPNVDSVLVGLRRIGPAGRPGGPRARARRVRAPPQGAGGIARARLRRVRPASVSGRGRPLRRSATDPTRGPSGCRRRSSSSWPRGCALAADRARPGQAQPQPAARGVRGDGRHRLVTLFESVSLYDELELTVRDGDAAVDEVVCPGVEGPNLVGAALAALRSQGWDGPGVRVEVRKRIPVAAGMGGGSADAAATLRLAAALRPVPAGAVETVAASLGADVPSQLVPGVSIGTGAGEVVQAVSALEPHAYVIVPLAVRPGHRRRLPGGRPARAAARGRRAGRRAAGADRAAGASRRRASLRAGRQRPRASGDLPAAGDRRRARCRARRRRAAGIRVRVGPDGRGDCSPVPTRGPARRPQLTRSCPATLGPAPPSRSRRISVSRSLRRGGPRSPSKIRVGRRILGHNS